MKDELLSRRAALEKMGVTVGGLMLGSTACTPANVEGRYTIYTDPRLDTAGRIAQVRAATSGHGELHISKSLQIHLMFGDQQWLKLSANRSFNS